MTPAREKSKPDRTKPNQGERPAKMKDGTKKAHQGH